jgi:hypothetical protein
MVILHAYGSHAIGAAITILTLFAVFAERTAAAFREIFAVYTIATSRTIIAL